MKSSKYVAYVASYTINHNAGIHIYDVDDKNGKLSPRGEISIHNASYITTSRSKKYLYSITDRGVEAFSITKTGDLEPLNFADINGMRGCYLSTDYTDKFLFVAGYHDGKITVLTINPDGSLGHITDEIFHRGLSTVAERNFRPHVSCVKMTPDNKYLCAADLGLDHIKVYKLNFETGKLKLVDIVRSEVESAPRHINFSDNGKFAYVIHEQKNYISVYSYEEENGNHLFTNIQTVSTLNSYHAGGSSASAMRFTEDGNYLFCSNAGDNSVGFFKVDKETGLLTKINVLPISGTYPKDISIFPNGKHLVSLNHESNTMTFFSVDYEKGTIVMNGKEIQVDTGNCIIMVPITE